MTNVWKWDIPNLNFWNWDISGISHRYLFSKLIHGYLMDIPQGLKLSKG